MIAALAEFYAQGGIYMHPISLWGIIAAVLLVLQALDPERHLLLMIWGAFGLMLLCGATGVVVGLIEAFSAVAAAPPDMREALVRMSLAIALNPVGWALLIVVLLAQFALPITWWVLRRRRSAHTERLERAAA